MQTISESSGLLLSYESIHHAAYVFRNASVSLPSVTTRGVKLKISELIASGKLPWDRILIDFPHTSLNILLISRLALFTNELEECKTRNSFKFKSAFEIAIISPNFLTSISSYRGHDLYFCDSTSASLKPASLTRSTKLPFIYTVVGFARVYIGCPLSLSLSLWAIFFYFLPPLVPIMRLRKHENLLYQKP